MSQRFDHIKVGAHREPDQVIYAGQGAAAAEELSLIHISEPTRRS